MTPEVRCAELVEVIEPILDNATRFTPVGGAVDIDVRLDRGPVERLVVLVSNTGPGVSPEMALLLFDAWVSSRDASIAGGLGLWLARETARDTGGDIALCSSGTDTTAFRIDLPTLVSGTELE